MRTIRIMASTISFVVLAACTHGTSSASIPSVAAPETAESSAQGDVVVLGIGGGIGAVDASSGQVVSLVPGAIPEPDWSHVYATTTLGGSTRVDRIATATGETVSSVSLAGDLQIRAVAPLGQAIALMPPRTGSADAWVPEARARTRIVVADPSGATDPERFSLKGNFEPEAFSPDAKTLFTLQYRPALAPTSYRVVGLSLETGRRWALIGPDKQPVENMTATRLVQVASPDGSYLYTLYTNQRPAYLQEPATSVDQNGDAEVAFVHTVDLRDGFAVCIALPDAFGAVPQQSSALAISPDGHQVYAIDAEHGTIATVNVRRYRVSDVTHVDLSMFGSSQIHARVSADGATLFVAGDAGLLALDTQNLTPRGTVMATPGAVTGLALSSDGARLYLSWGNELQLFDAATLEPANQLQLASDGAVEFVGTTGP
ncbi:MAG: YncE family protein [Actinomycetota bacterium]